MHRKQGLFFWCAWRTLECLQGQIHNPMWKKWLKLVDPGERTKYFLDVFLMIVNYESLLEECKKMFEWRISLSAGATPKLFGCVKSHAKRVAWSFNMVMICVGRYCELANKKVEQLYKVCTPCLADHQFLKKKKKEELETVGELLKVCSFKISWNAYLCPELVDLTFFGSWTKLHE